MFMNCEILDEACYFLLTRLLTVFFLLLFLMTSLSILIEKGSYVLKVR